MIRRTLRAFLADEQGLETVEYAVLLALILAGVITGVKLLGPTVSNAFTSVNTAMTAP